jgi:hypothetical protein
MGTSMADLRQVGVRALQLIEINSGSDFRRTILVYKK